MLSASVDSKIANVNVAESILDYHLTTDTTADTKAYTCGFTFSLERLAALRGGRR